MAKVKEYILAPTATKSISENGTNIDVLEYKTASVNVTQNILDNISDPDELTAKMVAANNGKAYKYTGEDGTYTNGNLYLVVEE